LQYSNKAVNQVRCPAFLHSKDFSGSIVIHPSLLLSCRLFYAQVPDVRYLEIMQRFAHLAAEGCNSQLKEQQNEQSENDDNDSLHPWCFCQQPSNGNFKIMCDHQGDNCYKW